MTWMSEESEVKFTYCIDRIFLDLLIVNEKLDRLLICIRTMCNQAISSYDIRFLRGAVINQSDLSNLLVLSTFLTTLTI